MGVVADCDRGALPAVQEVTLASSRPKGGLESALGAPGRMNRQILDSDSFGLERSPK